MKFKEIREMTSDELVTKKRDLRQESLHLRLQQQSGQLEQPSRLRLLRREVARFETVLSERAAEDGDEIVLWPKQPNSRQRTARRTRTRGTRKTRTGEVISSGMNKTIVVQSVTRVPHAKFGKIVKQKKKVLRPRRREQGESRRHGADHGDAAAQQVEAWRLVEVVAK